MKMMMQLWRLEYRRDNYDLGNLCQSAAGRSLLPCIVRNKPSDVDMLLKGSMVFGVDTVYHCYVIVLADCRQTAVCECVYVDVCVCVVQLSVRQGRGV